MGAEGYKRKLTAIMSADVAGYSRFMGDNESETVKTLEAYKEIMFALNKQLVDRTKTGREQIIPCTDGFRPVLEYMTSQKVRVASPYFFVNPNGKKPGKHYTVHTLEGIWNEACKKVGEKISCYPGTKHSTCSQLINEYGYSIHEVQMVTDHARLDSVKQYAEVEVSAKQRLIDRKGQGKKVVLIKKAETDSV
jgi:site-specific recombinase XerD